MTAILNPDTVTHLLATDSQIARTVKNLEANNMHTLVAENGAEAWRQLFAILPAHAEVFVSHSTTLLTLGITDEINTSGRFQPVHLLMDRQESRAHNRDVKKLSATPEFMIGSVQAITESGSVLIASMTGSRITGYAAGAGHVIWVVGTQKIVRSLEEGFNRITEYVLPLEDARVFQALGSHSEINKVMIVYKEVVQGRISIILVKENLGF
jgi:hypothetical protein